MIDYVISTISNRVIHYNILHTEEIIDHEDTSVIFDIKNKKYQPRYKFVSKEKTLDMNTLHDFQQLPRSFVYLFDDPGG